MMTCLKDDKGMTTIEATIIIPMCFAVILLLLWFGFFLYDRNVLSQAAGIAVITGSQASEYRNEEIQELVEERFARMVENRLIWMEEPVISVTVEYTKIRVEVTGTLTLPEVVILTNLYGRNVWEIQVCQEAPRLRASMVTRTVSRVRQGLSANTIPTEETETTMQ